MNAQLKGSAAIRTALIWSLICAGVAGATFVLGNLFRHVVLIFLGKLGILIAIGVSLLLWGLSRLLGTARAKNVMQNLALLLASVMIAVLLGEVVVRIALNNTIHEVAVLRQTVLKAQPDFVLLQWTVNDVAGQIEQPSGMRLIPSSTLEPLLHRYSALFLLIDQQWQSLQYSWGLNEPDPSYYRRLFGDPNSPRSQVYRQELITFIEVSERAGVPLAILLFPAPDAPPGGYTETSYPVGFLHERVLEICAQRQIPCIDLRANLAPYTHSSDYKRMYVNRFDWHPSAFANRIAADVLLERFRDTWISGINRQGVTRP